MCNKSKISNRLFWGYDGKSCHYNWNKKRICITDNDKKKRRIEYPSVILPFPEQNDIYCTQCQHGWWLLLTNKAVKAEDDYPIGTNHLSCGLCLHMPSTWWQQMGTQIITTIFWESLLPSLNKDSTVHSLIVETFFAIQHYKSKSMGP